MTIWIWIDAQLSPALAPWLSRRFEVEAVHVRDLGLVEATDPAIFHAAGLVAAVVLTKDRDFVDLVKGRGSPPQVVALGLREGQPGRVCETAC